MSDDPILPPSFLQLHEQTLREKEELLDLKNEVRRLTKLRNRLKRQWSEISSLEPVTEGLLQNQSGLASASPQVSHESAELQNVAKKRKIRAITDAYRLTGMSGFVLPLRREIGIRFDTYFKGEFGEAFYVFIIKDNNELVLHKNTLPSFIPVDRLASKFLNTNMKEFLDCINEYLQCFEARRMQVLELKTKDPSVDDINATEAFDYIQFVKHHNSTDYECRFLFDLKGMTPTRIHITSANKQQRHKDLEQMFVFRYLLDGVKSAWPDS